MDASPQDNSSPSIDYYKIDKFNVATIKKTLSNTSDPQFNNGGYENIILNMSWPAATLVFAIIFILIFRKPISKFIGDRMTKFKAGKDGIETEASETTSRMPEKDEKQVSESEYAEEKKDERKDEEKMPTTKEEWEKEMILAAIIAKDRKKTDEAYAQMTKLEEDRQKKKDDKILYLKMSHRLGDTNAINELKDLLADPDIIFSVNMGIGSCYEYSEDLENAKLFYSSALKTANNEKEKTLATQRYAEVLYRDSGTEEAVEILSNTLTDTREDKHKIILYEKLADILGKEKDYEQRAFVIDKAIELMPNDSSLLFKAGYSYAESIYDELSLLHYKNARDVNPKDDAVQNNLGVQYDNLEMPIKSIESYKKSESLLSTLASSNLAFRLINIGFIEEAKKILNLAKEKEDVHQNVNEALSEIPKRIEKENKIEDDQIKKALSLRKFVLRFVEAKYIKGNSLASSSGNWKSKDGIDFVIEVSGGNIVAKWKEKIWDYENEFKFQGKIENNSSRITFYKKEYDFSKQADIYKRKERGLLYFSIQKNQIDYMKIDDARKSKTLQTLTKI